MVVGGKAVSLSFLEYYPDLLSIEFNIEFHSLLIDRFGSYWWRMINVLVIDIGMKVYIVYHHFLQFLSLNDDITRLSWSK